VCVTCRSGFFSVILELLGFCVRQSCFGASAASTGGGLFGAASGNASTGSAFGAGSTPAFGGERGCVSSPLLFLCRCKAACNVLISALFLLHSDCRLPGGGLRQAVQRCIYTRSWFNVQLLGVGAWALHSALAAHQRSEVSGAPLHLGFVGESCF
jgi:hypothetical protein